MLFFSSSAISHFLRMRLEMLPGMLSVRNAAASLAPTQDSNAALFSILAEEAVFFEVHDV